MDVHHRRFGGTESKAALTGDGCRVPENQKTESKAALTGDGCRAPEIQKNQSYR